MNSKFTLALMGILVIALAHKSVAQKIWVPEVELLKAVPPGKTVPIAIQHMDNSASVGSFDSAYALTSDGKINYKLVSLKNTIKKVNGIWRGAGNASLNADQYSEGASLFSYVKIGDEDYVGGEDYYSPIKKLNVGNDTYEPLIGLTFTLYYSTYPQFFFEWGGGKVLLYNFPGGSGSNTINGETFRNAAIWNRQTNTVEHTHSIYGQEGIIGKSKFANDTLFVYNGSARKIFFLKKGENTWSELISTPSAHQACWIDVVNGKIYIIAGGIGTFGNYDLKYVLYRLDGNSWTKLLEMDPAGVYDYRADAIVGVVYRNGIFHIAGKFAKADGKDVAPVVAYDESKDSVWSAAPMPAPLNGLQKPGLYLQGLYLVGNEIFLPTTVGTVNQFWGQTVFTLKGNTLPAPTITGPSGVKSSFTVTSSGTALPNVKINLYLKNGPKIGSVQADNNGNWQLPFMLLVDGQYEVYAKSENADGDESKASESVKFSIDTEKPAMLTPTTPADNSTFQLEKTVTFAAMGAEFKLQALFRMVGTGNTNLNYTETVSAVNGTVSVSKLLDQPGTFQWSFIPVDSAGNMGLENPQRLFTVSSVLGVVDPDDPNIELKLYPNPAVPTAQVSINNTINVSTVSVYDAKGCLVVYRLVPPGMTKFSFNAPLTIGMYAVVGRTRKNNIVKFKLLVR